MPREGVRRAAIIVQESGARVSGKTAAKIIDQNIGQDQRTNSANANRGSALRRQIAAHGAPSSERAAVGHSCQPRTGSTVHDQCAI